MVEDGFIECKDLHEFSCEYATFRRFFGVLKLSYLYYIPIHYIPMIIFKWKRLIKDPIGTIKKTTKNYLKSLLFMGLYIIIIKYLICKLKNFR